MDDRDWTTLDSPRVVMVSAVAASALGGLVVALARRRRAAPPPPPPRDLRAVLADPRVRSVAAAAREGLGGAKARVEFKDGEAVREEIARKVEQVLDTARTELPPLTREATIRAREAAERLKEEGASLSADVGERLRSDVAPVAKTWAQEAISEAEEILAAARERAAGLSASARKDLKPRMRTRTAAASGLLGGAAAGIAQSLGSQLGRVSRPAARRPAPPARRRVSERGGKMLQQAGSQAKYVGRESLSIAFWSAVLGAVVYFGLLSAERREQVRRFITGTIQQVRDVMSDFQGDEGPSSGTTL